MDKVYTVIIMKDRTSHFDEDSYYESSSVFTDREDAKEYLKKCYSEYLNSMLDEINMEFKDIEEEDICLLKDDSFVIGCEGGLIYYYGLLKEVNIQ